MTTRTHHSIQKEIIPFPTTKKHSIQFKTCHTITACIWNHCILHNRFCITLYHRTDYIHISPSQYCHECLTAQNHLQLPIAPTLSGLFSGHIRYSRNMWADKTACSLFILANEQLCDLKWHSPCVMDQYF